MHTHTISIDNTITSLRHKMHTIFLIITACFLCIPSLSQATQETAGKILVLYYSNTGNSRAVCDALQEKLGADIVEIKDLKNNPGKLTMKTKLEKPLVMDTEIEPKTIDMSAYSSVIVGSPIWMGGLSPAIRKFAALNTFDRKKIVIVTTTNASENEELKEKNKGILREAKGDVVGYYQILAMEEKDGAKVERTKEQIVEDALKLLPGIQKSFQ
jgi:flavodoxin